MQLRKKIITFCLIIALACVGQSKCIKSPSEKKKEIYFTPAKNNWIDKAVIQSPSVKDQKTQESLQTEKNKEPQTEQEKEAMEYNQYLLKEIAKIIIKYNSKKMTIKREEHEDVEGTEYFRFEKTENGVLKAHPITHRNVEQVRKHSDLQTIRRKGAKRMGEYILVTIGRILINVSVIDILLFLIKSYMYNNEGNTSKVLIDIYGSDPLGFPVIIVGILLLSLVFLTYKPPFRRVRVFILFVISMAFIAMVNSIVFLYKEGPLKGSIIKIGDISKESFFINHTPLILCIVFMIVILAIEAGFKTRREQAQPNIRRRRVLRAMLVFMAVLVFLVVFFLHLNKGLNGDHLIESISKHVQDNMLSRMLAWISITVAFFVSIMSLRLNTKKDEKVSKAEKILSAETLAVFGVILTSLVLLQLFSYQAGIANVSASIRIIEGVLAASLVPLALIFFSTTQMGRYSSIRKHRTKIILGISLVLLVCIIASIVVYTQTAEKLISEKTSSILKGFLDNPIEWFQKLIIHTESKDAYVTQ
ncbi:hypothetical protein NEFER03_0586 [Nematocida sp. LUAm3]|nr:hypothetical protein NEFER03_0586 [Nematocida sp. LUAm3]KAI5175553.1 hypothetical protein NEFER02_1459 [Nematocida sp. LUAm2]KAI5178417.1 hypothetical protein NEFER01_1564 [Nematocida sp. LUAm1]